MALQSLTLAISPDGLRYFSAVLLDDALLRAMAQLTPPDRCLERPMINYGGHGSSTNFALDVKINLTGGAMASFKPAITSLTQQDNGHFAVVMTAINFQATYQWRERFTQQVCSFGFCSILGAIDRNYTYAIGFGSMVANVVFQFQPGDHAWQLTLRKSELTNTQVVPAIPSGSMLNNEVGGGFGSHVAKETEKVLDVTDFGSRFNALLAPLFGSIPASGHLTPQIVFHFPVGPGGLTFPGNSGMALGVSGEVRYNDVPYPGANPPQLALPPVPTSHHLHYYVADYAFNALFWAFFCAGGMHATASQGNVPDPAVLNTANYKGTPLQALYLAYPNLPMMALITARAAPTVQFEAVYDLSAAQLGQLRDRLPGAIYSLLEAGLVGAVYMDEAAFMAALVGLLGQADADQYKALIESVARVLGAVVRHRLGVDMQVLSHGSAVTAFTFELEQTDVLQGFVLDHSGNTQTLQFQFQIVPSLTVAKLLSSTITGIDAGAFAYIWNWVLQPVFASQMNKIGKAGVALPRIAGFNFLFAQAQITLNSGYVAVLANVEHIADGGAAQRDPARP